MAIDKQLRQEIRSDIRDEFRQCMEGLQERWVTAETLSQHVETLRPRWLERNGHCFNRTRVEFTDKDGNRHAQQWLYPLNEIMAMVQDGRIKELKL